MNDNVYYGLSSFSTLSKSILEDIKNYFRHATRIAGECIVSVEYDHEGSFYTSEIENRKIVLSNE